MRPYNGSIFTLRRAYKTVFPEKELAALDDEENEDEKPALDMTKVYKIKYSVNLLPIIGPYVIAENRETG